MAVLATVAAQGVANGGDHQHRGGTDQPRIAQDATKGSERSAGDERRSGAAQQRQHPDAHQAEDPGHGRARALGRHQAGTCGASAAVMRTQSARAAALSAANERASITRSATRGSATL